MKKNILLGILVFFLLSSLFNLNAQTDTEFWFVVPEIVQQHNDRPIRFVFTTTDFAADITIEMPANGAFSPINLSLAANTTDWIEYSLDADITMFENRTIMDELSAILADRDNISNKGIRITSTAPITCYYEVNTTNNSDIWSLKGSNGLGKDFYIPFQDIGQNRILDFPERAWSSIEIIGTGGTTVIQIVPENAVFRDGANPSETNPYTITLEQGEVYTLAPAWDPAVQHGQVTDLGWWGVYRDQHIGGTHIHVQSGDDVAVVVKDDSVTEDLSEHPDDPQPDDGFGGGWDIIADQWVPQRILGTEYIAMRGDLVSDQEFVFVVATEDNTRIWWTSTAPVDTTVAPVDTTVNEGKQVRISFPNTEAYKYIISNKKLSVLHVSGTGTEMGGAVLPPIDKCTGSTTIGFTRSKPDAFHMNIMVRTTAKDGFLINGAAPTFFSYLSFTDILGTDWSIARIQNITTANVPVGSTTTISNTKDVFHLGIINETNGGAGCRFGYFSGFNELIVSATTIQGDGAQPSSTIRACKGDTIQLYASGGSSFNWWPSTNLSSTTISNPTFAVDSNRIYYVEVSGACNIKDTASVSIEMVEPNTNFSLNTLSGQAPLEIELTNLTTDADTFMIDWENDEIFDLSFNSNMNQVYSHVFQNNSDTDSIFTIVLKAWSKNNGCDCTYEKQITVKPGLVADYTLDNNNGCSPLNVNITNNSIGEDSVYLIFGDNTIYDDTSFTSLNHTYLNNSDTVVQFFLEFHSISNIGGDKEWYDTVTVFPEITLEFVDKQDVQCYGMGNGTVTANPLTGFTPVNYLWSTGDTTSFINNLDGGVYKITVTDSNNCSYEDSITINEPSQSSCDIISEDISCFGNNDGSASVINSSGVPPFSYLWSTGDTISSISYLSSGIYSVTIADANDCLIASSTTIWEPQELQFTATHSDITCYGSQDGSIIVTSSGGTGSIQYSIDDGLTFQSSNTFDELSSGSYTVLVKDENNCITAQQVISISEPEILEVDLGNDKIICNGASIVLTAEISGGTPPYNITWSDDLGEGQTHEVSPTEDTLYIVTVIDDNNCMQKDTVNIDVLKVSVPEICMVSVDSLNHNLVIWNQPDNLAFNSIYIYKETSQSDIYEKIGSQLATEIAVFADTESNPAQNSSRYRIAVLDTCGFETEQSDYHKTMHLTINSGIGGAWNLIWDGYEGFNYSTYNIYRGTSDNNLLKIAEQASNTFTYTDQVPPVGTIYYQIEVINPNPCNVSNSKSIKNYYESTKSNMVTSSEVTSVFALLPESIEIYPNPANNKLYIKSNMIKEDITISILTIDGKLISSEESININSEIDISVLNTGMYILRLNIGDNLVYKKFIKQ